VLASHADTFDVVYLHRSQVAAFYAPLVRLHQPSARLVFAVADLSSMRVQRQSETEVRPELLSVSRYDALLEKNACDWADAVITHSSIEATVLRQRFALANVHVVPFAVASRESRVPFASRSGLAFIGSYGHPPNVDAAIWLADGIMPAVTALNPSIQAFLVGSAMPEHVRAMASASVIPLGPVDELSTIFDRVRLTVAPLAYGAGVKGKVLDSLAAGVPCVCTPMAAEGLDLPEPLNALVASNVKAIAALIARVHDDDSYNATCAAAGRSYIAARASNEAVDVALRVALDPK
jgi:glycosyltransferase involved in cell wall biosynthesis